ncbi:histidine kinase [Longilinea arvoryzae]|uniref:histidine kinase n=1 Tax=Longilinea arvoryzae TaxID=360412 RepID=A0A0S7BLC9_9CHLR|nr:ATP-binding protein [Longilinea arvoryzae]GAP15112.1 histidine kinase [Longilinea arvoryzae]
MTETGSLTPEILVARLGDSLVEKGLISPADLEKALQVQQAHTQKGQTPLLGKILIDMKLIDQPALDQVVTEQILQLRTALQEKNNQLEEANNFLELRVQERTAELQNALTKLAELSQLKSNFVANISHELRTPLTHIRGYLELLSSGDLGTVNNEQYRSLMTMQRSTDRLEKLIEDLIMFSMAEHGTINLHVKTVNINQLCKDLVEAFQQLANEHHHTLTFESNHNSANLQADREKMQWVIQQLIENAIKFTPDGGTIQVKTEKENEFIAVRVSDNGIGMPQERIDEIFEPFHQLDGSSTRKYGGTGLGLALVKKIIEAHGSMIRVTSQPGRGSTFEFLLRTAD